jgi:hypothetical protein
VSKAIENLQKAQELAAVVYDTRQMPMAAAA